jgi:hypothetical protein
LKCRYEHIRHEPPQKPFSANRRQTADATADKLAHRSQTGKKLAENIRHNIQIRAIVSSLKPIKSIQHTISHTSRDRLNSVGMRGYGIYMKMSALGGKEN